MLNINEILKKQGLNTPLVTKRLFFEDESENCYNIRYHLENMAENHISEMVLYIAEREVGVPYFFCKNFCEVGEKSEGGCGKMCIGYEPRNRKSGVCKHYGFVYNQTEQKLTITLESKYFAF